MYFSGDEVLRRTSYELELSRLSLTSFAVDNVATFETHNGLDHI